MEMSDIRSIDLNLLVAFDAMFDERSVSRAAEKVGANPTHGQRHAEPVAQFIRRPALCPHSARCLADAQGRIPRRAREVTARGVRGALVEPETFHPATAEMTFSISVNGAIRVGDTIHQSDEEPRAENRSRERVVGFSAADEIEKLDRLKKAGSITDAEFARLRAKLVQ